MCLFCKIIKGEIPCYKIYEDAYFLAFLDISQATPGHTLVIPKKHYETIFTMDEELCKKMLLVVKNVAHLLKKKLGVNSINILNNSGENAGQTVPHFHIHLIPRYENDGITLCPPAKNPDKSVLESAFNQITK